MIAKDKVIEVCTFYNSHSREETLKFFKLKESTLERYLREYKKYNEHEVTNSLLKRIGDIYTEDELKAIAKGGKVLPGQQKIPIVTFKGEKIKFAHFSDTHIGSIYFVEKYLLQAIEECKREKVEFICHTGDVTDGMSSRPGAIYELTHIGYEKQREYAIELLSNWKKPLYCIDGNHDRWYLKNSNIGANIVKDIAEALPHGIFLGHDEGDISVNGVIIKLWHGEDGAAPYALSFRSQKIIESFTGGEKPHILLTGHDHKYIKAFIRNVHVLGSGAISMQSKWMRGKRMANHTGFSINEVWVNNASVVKIRSTFYPFYS